MSAYPWYDSNWLATCVAAKAWLAHHEPAKLREFEALLAPLRTDPDFVPKRIAHVFDDDTLRRIRETIRGLAPSELELHEARDFGRFVVHDHAVFTGLQRGLASLVSEAAGEALEPRYNFLSLYTKTGRCAPHMDAPLAKWTLDVCIDQNVAWPIHFSQVVPWPEAHDYGGPGWEARVRADPRLRFAPVTLQPGAAVLFSGSSQWHYREAMPRSTDGAPPFCTLLFFHFIPRGCAELVEPRNWPRLLGVPELQDISKDYVG